MDMNLFLKKLYAILLNSQESWDKASEERGMRNTLIYLLSLILLGIVVSFIIDFIELQYASPELLSRFTPFAQASGLSISVLLFLTTIGIYLLMFIGTFIVPVAIHIFIKMFKGQGKYAETYRAFVYGATPTLLLYNIPFIGKLARLYTIYLQTVGLSKLHKISIGKAAASWILGSILFTLLVVGIAWMFFLLRFR